MVTGSPLRTLGVVVGRVPAARPDYTAATFGVRHPPPRAPSHGEDFLANGKPPLLRLPRPLTPGWMRGWLVPGVPRGGGGRRGRAGCRCRPALAPVRSHPPDRGARLLPLGSLGRREFGQSNYTACDYTACDYTAEAGDQRGSHSESEWSPQTPSRQSSSARKGKPKPAVKLLSFKYKQCNALINYNVSFKKNLRRKVDQ